MLEWFTKLNKIAIKFSLAHFSMSVKFYACLTPLLSYHISYQRASLLLGKKKAK